MQSIPFWQRMFHFKLKSRCGKHLHMWKMIFQARRNVSHWTVGKVGVISSRWNPRHLFIKSFLTEFILDSMGLLRKMYNISILNPRLPLPVLTLCFFTFPLSFCLFGFGFLGVFWFFFFFPVRSLSFTENFSILNLVFRSEAILAC